MKMDKTFIRTAKEKDAERLLEIYAPYVTDTAIFSRPAGNKRPEEKS